MKFTIRNKLIGGFLAVLLLLGCIVGLANFEISQMDQMYSKMLGEDAQQVSTIQNYKAEVFKQSSAVNAYLLTKDYSAVTEYHIEFSRFTKAYNALEAAEKDQKGKDLLAKMKLAQNQFFQVVNQEVEFKKQNNEDEYILLATSTAKDAAEGFQTAAENVVKYKTGQMKMHQTMVTQQMNSVKTTILIFSILALLVGLAVAFLVSFLISRPVNTVSNTLKQLAQGNLTVPDVKVKSKDEIGILASSMNDLLHNLKDLIGKVYDSSVQVASSSEQLLANNEQNSRAAEQIAHSVQQTASGAEKQLVHFEEVSSSVQEMVAGITQIVESSEFMQQSTDKATHLTKDGTMSVKAVVSHMNDINDSFEQTSKIVSLLGNRSQEINGIASLITAIAEQTNLLALNAAIEAARAGEHGKGFAVVADEVRKLAVQSKNSADKITDMIRFVHDETNQAIKAVENGNQLVEKGISATKEANHAFSSISCSIEEVSSKVQEVSAAVEELTAQSHTIVKSIEYVKEIAEQGMFATQESSAATQEQVATMEEVTTSAHGLHTLADELQAAVARFKL
jgi:methyl-accepting chemotaxis protein